MTISSIVVTTGNEQCYRVTVTGAGSCKDNPAVSVDPNAPGFLDGFESGDTAMWSHGAP